MNAVSSALLVSLSCMSSHVSAIAPFPNIGFVGKGYDIMFGNPHATRASAGADPGFRAPVFDLTVYNTGGKTPDQRYLVPDGISVSKCSKCNLNFQMTDIAGSSSYQNSLEVDVNIKAKYDGASFSASTDYKWVKGQTSSKQHVFTESSAVCCVYTSSVNQYARPPFSHNFKLAVERMPTTYQAASFAKFIDSFGTHVPETVSMGGRFGVRSTFSNNSWSMMSSSNLDIKAAAGYATLGASLAVGSMQTDEIQKGKSFTEFTINQTEFFVGGLIPKDGTVTTWIGNAQKEPMPLSVTLASIETLLTVDNFKSDSNIAAKRAALTTALKKYCASLKAQGKVSSCNPPPPDAPFPPASIFGGLYQVNDGCTGNVNNAYTKGLSCPGGYTPHPIGRVFAPEGRCGGTIQLCLAQNQTTDPLHAFGGMYSHADYNSDTTDNFPNFLTGHYNCPSGYSRVQTGRVLTPDRPIDGAALVMCLNMNAPLASTPIAGAYQCADEGTIDHVFNPYTNACSCPPGFTNQHYGRILTAENHVGAPLIVCLSNVV